MKPYLFEKLLFFGVFASSVLLANVLNITPPISQVTTEAGGFVEYNMTMTTQPSEDVYVGCQLSDISEGTCSSYVAFTSSDWNTSKNYRITGKNDYIIDGNQTYEVTFSYATSNDSEYSGTEKFTLINTDDDTQKVVVNPPLGLYTFESGTTATFSVVLQSAPTSDVNISLSSSDINESVVDKSLLTFTPSDWNIEQVVTITGIDDNGSIDGTKNSTIFLDSVVSNDVNFSGYDPIDMSIDNYDIHSETINIKAYGSSQTFESNTSIEAVYGFTLNYKPIADVTVLENTTVNSAEFTVSHTSFIFTADNWNVEQNLTITGVGDSNFDGDYSQTISYRFDGSFSSIGYLNVTNVDDEGSIFITNVIDSQSGESDNNASFSFSLGKEPTETVTVSFSSSDTSEANVSVSSLEFNATNWNIPQVVNIYGIDDNLTDLTQTYSVVFTPISSLDMNYAWKVPDNLTFTNEDNETASVGIVATDIVTSESGETASFLVSLDVEPASYTRVSVISSDTTEGIISTPSLGYLSFTTQNWDTPQEVVVTGLSDGLYDGTKSFSANLSFSSRLDSGYSAMTKVVSLSNVDKTLPTLSPVSAQTQIEDFESQPTITLNSNDPNVDLFTYTASSSNPSIVDVSVSGNILTIVAVENGEGNAVVTINATINGNAVTQNFDVNVTGVNDTPTINTVFEDIALNEDNGTTTYDLNVSDVEGDSLKITVDSSDENILRVSSNLDEWTDQATWTLSLDFNLTTVENENGMVSITVIADDGDKNATKTFDVNVTPVNDAVTMSSLIANINTYKNFDDMNLSLGVEDVDGDTLEYSLVYDDSLVHITAADSRLIISSIVGVSGKTDVNLTVSDAQTNATQNFTINVLSLEDGDGVEESGEVEVTTVDGNETLKITIAEDDLEVLLVKYNDGTVSHKVTLGEKETTAVSNLINAIVELMSDGVITKYEENLNALIEVVANLLGQTIHSLRVGADVTQATFESAGALTVIDKDGDGNITVTSTMSSPDRNITIVAKEDGSSEQNVTKAGTTIILVSKLKGTKTIVRVNGDVETLAGKYDDSKGYYVKIKFIVKADGTNEGRLIRVNKTDSSDVSDISQAILFPEGTEIEIFEDGGMLYMKATISLTKRIVIK